MSNGYKNEFYTPEVNTAVLRRRLRPENMAPAKPGHRQLSPFGKYGIDKSKLGIS